MPVRNNYSSQEWETLVELPYLAAAAVVELSESGTPGKIKEVFSIYPGVNESARRFPNNVLIQAILSYDEQQEKKEKKAKKKQIHPSERQGVGAYVLKKCHEVSSVLEQKCSAREASEYRQWLILCAEHVAKAARVGGFFGVGGRDLDEHETQFLSELRNVLGVKE
jgi:hypothetical protein